jgi:hypothetical protein
MQQNPSERQANQEDLSPDSAQGFDVLQTSNGVCSPSLLLHVCSSNSSTGSVTMNEVDEVMSFDI